MKLANISAGKNRAREAKKPAVLLLLLPFLFTLTLPQAQAQKFTLQRLNPPGSTYAFARGLNNKGKVVGSFVNANSVYVGFIYDGAKYKAVVFSKSASSTQANGVNDSNVVAGNYIVGQLSHGFFLRNGKFTRYDVKKGVPTYIYGINNAGNFVGSTGNDGANQGFVNRGGRVTVFSVNGNPTVAFAINNKNRSVGSFLDPDLGRTHGFSRDAAGKITRIDHPGARVTVCLGINDSGEITGLYVDSADVSHGFSLKNGKFHTSPLPDIAGINNAGVFVGSFTGKDNKNYGYVATPR